MIVATSGFSLLIFQTTSKFLNDQIILDLSKTSMHVSEIPFPALTICPKFLDEKLLSEFQLKLVEMGSSIEDQRLVLFQ